jgi:hypothetical protein
MITADGTAVPLTINPETGQVLPSANTRAAESMDKLQLIRKNLGRVFKFRNGHVHAVHFLCYRVKMPNLKLKTWPKQLLGFLPLDIALLNVGIGSTLQSLPLQ